MRSTTQEVTVLTGPDGLAYRLLSFSSTDWGAFAIFASLGMYLWVNLAFPGLVIAVLFVGYMMWPLAWSRRYYAWGEAIYSQWIRIVHQGILWESGDEYAINASTRRWWRKLLSRAFSRVAVFALLVDELFDYGLIHNLLDTTDSLVIRGDGSSIAAEEPQRQYDLQEMLAEELRRIAGYQKLTATVGFTLRRRPTSQLMFDANQDSHAHPDVVIPEAIVKAHETGKTVDELYAAGEITRQELRDYRLHVIDVAQARSSFMDEGCSVDMVAVITIKRSSRLAMAARSGGKPLEANELRRERIVQLANSMLDALGRAGVGNPIILNPDQCRDYLRSAWDVNSLPEYYGQRVAAESQSQLPIQHREEVSSSRSKLRFWARPKAVAESVPLYHPQHSIQVNDNICVMDDTGHAVVRLTKLPAKIYPWTMHDLFTHSDVRWISRTLASETTTGTREYLGLTWLSKIQDDVMSVVPGLWGKKTELKRERLDAQTSRIANEGHIEYFNCFVAVANSDPELLELDVEEVLRAVNNIGGRAERVTGRSRLVRATLTANTGIPLL